MNTQLAWFAFDRAARRIAGRDDARNDRQHPRSAIRST